MKRFRIHNKSPYPNLNTKSLWLSIVGFSFYLTIFSQLFRYKFPIGGMRNNKVRLISNSGR